MLNTKQTDELEALTTIIHGQILSEHGSSADAPTELAQSALHNLMAGMCNGEERSLHARVNFAAPTWFGKSTACAAFLAAAWQLGYLGHGVTVTYAASRVSQLYDFEDTLLHAGIPLEELRRNVSVLHSSTGKDMRRSSDLDTDAPILLITHERIRGVYRRAEGCMENDLCYFLKHKGAERDLLLWDERCQTTESGAIKLMDLHQAIAGLKAQYGKEPSHSALVTWLENCERIIAREVSRQTKQSATGLASNVGALLPLLPQADTQAFYSLLLHQCRDLKRDSFNDLRDFLESLRFKPRVVSTSNGGAGLVHYRVVIPDEATRVVNLDASYGVSELSQINSRTTNGLIDAEQFCPILRQMFTRYGKHLKDLKDCSDHTFIHWQHGVENCLRKAGVDIDRLTYEDLSCKGAGKRSRRQVVVETYGQHDAVNCYSYTQVACHVGIQQRNEVELSGAICGESRSMTRAIPFTTVHTVKTTEKAVVLQQSTGRSCSRKILNGKSLPQLTWMIYQDTEKENLTATLRPWFPQARWEDYRPVYAEESQGVVETWTKRLVQHLNNLPKHTVRVSSRRLRQTLNAQVPAVTDMTWKRAVQQASRHTGWILEGRSIARLFPDAA